VKRRHRTARENGVRADALLCGRLKHAAVFMSRHEKHRMSQLGHSRQFSRDWAVSGYQAISEGPSARLQASAQALFKTAETGVSKSMRGEFTEQ
jgi:hypothetical protein